MKKTIAIILALFLGFCISTFISVPAHAQGQTVFGPEELTIGWWPSHLSFHTFTADNPGEGLLVVTKNTPEKHIRRGFILLNRQFIPLRSFFEKDDLVLEKDNSVIALEIETGRNNMNQTIKNIAKLLKYKADLKFIITTNHLALNRTRTILSSLKLPNEDSIQISLARDLLKSLPLNS